MVYKYKQLQLKDRRLRRKLKNLSLTFTRSGVAYDYQGNSVPENTPRFTHLINGVLQQGCLIEEAHTNLCTAEASLSISHDSPYTTGTLNGTYTFQCEGTGSYVLSGGATGTVSKDNPVTAAVSSATVTLTPATTSTLNQIIKLGYPLSWVLGGTTQNAETLTAPSSVLNIDTNGYSNLLTANQADGTDTSSNTTGFTAVLGSTLTSDTTEHYQGSRSFKCVTANAATNEGFYTDSAGVAASLTYTGTVRLKGTGTVIFRLQEYTSGDVYVAQTTSATITLTNDWAEYSVSQLFGSTGVKARLKVITASQQEAIIYMDSAQISATSGVKPWIPGGTRVNNGTGTIEMEAMYLPGSNKNAYLYSHATSATNRYELYSTMATMYHYTCALGSAVYSSKALVPSYYNWYKFATHTNSTSSNVFIDGVAGTVKNLPELPYVYGNIAFGSKTTGTTTFNGLIRNVCISLPKRADTDVTNRNTQNVNGVGFKVDKEIKLVAPLKNNLSAYRVRG